MQQQRTRRRWKDLPPNERRGCWTFLGILTICFLVGVLVGLALA